MENNRRDFMKASLGVAGVTSLSGCAGILEGEDSEEVDPIDQRFQYAFNDKTGTLGDIPESNVDPEDASEFQVIQNEVSEDNWEEMRRDDYKVARDFLAGEYEDLPQHSGHEGNVEKIIERTREIYENPQTARDDHTTKLLNEDSHDEIKFTRSLIHAVDTVTSVSSSGGSDLVVFNLAEHIAQKLSLDFEDFNLNTITASEPVGASRKDIIEKSVQKRPDGSKVGSRGMMHTAGLMTYSKDGELEAKYVEPTDATPERYFFHAIRDPEESAYTASLDKDHIEMINGDIQFPEHYLTGLELRKGLELESKGLLEEGAVARSFTSAAIELVDDASNNLSQLMANQNEGYDVTLSNSFVESADELAEDMKTEDLKNYSQFGRAVYQIFENSIGEDYKGNPIRGYDQPLKIDGTIENPEFYHLPGERPLK